MLNTKQEEVVKYKGSLVNIAGPGSGKTHTLISKIINLLIEKEELQKFLILTFTNSAANEIKERALTTIKKEKTNPNIYFGTFHAIFKRLLEEEKIFIKLDLGDNPNISMPKEILRYFTNKLKNKLEKENPDLINTTCFKYYEKEKGKIPQKINFTKTIMAKELIDGKIILKKIDNKINYLTSEKIKKVKSLKEVYEIIKEEIKIDISKEITQTLISIEEKKEMMESTIFGESIYENIIKNKITKKEIIEIINKTIEDFFENKFIQKSISFSDILLITLYTMNFNKKYVSFLQDKFTNIFVDEFQDTNIIQAEILYKLYNQEKNKICVIGDPYQSIYGFLGAKMKNILTASEKFNAKTIQLIENYRSNKNIVELTNYMGLNMKEKIENWQKCISSNKKVKNNRIKLFENKEEGEQSKLIKEKILEYPPKTKIGILNRNGNVYLLENELSKARMKYNKLGGEALGESIEIKFLIHIYLFILDNKKIESLLYILNGISGIGIKTIENFEETAIKELKKLKETGIDTKEINYKAPKKIENILNILKKLKEEENLEEIIKNIKKFYFEYLFKNIEKNWKRDRKEEALEKIQILFEEIKEKETISEILILLEDYITGRKREDKDLEHNITISTIHSAKGLEWDVVFLMNWDNTIFKKDKKEEAQRLAYVAISRAKEELYILSPSETFFEIREDYIQENKKLFEKEEELKEIIITFGKYKNYKIEEIPFNYLQWIMENKEDLINKNLINKRIINEIKKYILID